MREINEILNWSFTPSMLTSNADRIINTETKQSIKASIKKINKISEKSVIGLTTVNNLLLKDVYILFLNNKDKKYNDLLSLFTKRDARLLVLALDYHPETGELPILFSKNLSTALKIINDRWRDSFIIALWHILLKNWTILLKNKKQKEYLITLLKKKSEEYSGTRKEIQKIISSSDLILNSNSPSIYAQRMINENISIDKANELINQRELILGYEYFSEVSFNYINILTDKNINEKTLLDIYSFINKHNSKRNTLIACSQIINENKFNAYEKTIKEKSIELIADPIKKHLWVYSGLSGREEEYVESARKKLNAFFNLQLIKIFFENLVQDHRRKNYWLKFIDSIDDIKFIGNKYNYNKLKNIKSISKYVNHRYKTTSRNQYTCALVIYSKGYVFVEFTASGALYIYKQRNFTVNLNSVRSMKDLKLWSTANYACKNSARSDYVSLNEEGRITHQGNWENRFNLWMKNYYNHKSNIKYKKSYNPANPSNQLESKLNSFSKSIFTSLKENPWWKRK